MVHLFISTISNKKFSYIIREVKQNLLQVDCNNVSYKEFHF